jgi:hypothetical protein
MKNKIRKATESRATVRNRSHGFGCFGVIVISPEMFLSRGFFGKRVFYFNEHAGEQPNWSANTFRKKF